MRAAVSIIIPTRNRWPLMQRSLRGALAQVDVDVEVIVVDDRSTDGTAAGLAALGDNRVRVLRNERPINVSAVRNFGLAHASAPWTAFLDDDDLWAPHKLREQLAAAARRDAIFAYGAGVIVDERGIVLYEDRAPPDPDQVARIALRSNPIPGGCSNAIARTDVLRDVGGFDEQMHLVADWDLWIRLSAAGRSACCEEILVAYVMHPGNMVTGDDTGWEAEFALLVAKHRDRAREHGQHVDGLAFQRWVASGRWRAGRRREAARMYLSGARHNITVRNVGYLAYQVLNSFNERLRPPPPPRDPPWLELYR
jgi:glycosyltransferase involved in cell wall biosynthesis